MKAKLHPYIVRDKHTRNIEGTYTTQKTAEYAAARMGEKFKSPKRYVVEHRGYR